MAVLAIVALPLVLFGCGGSDGTSQEPPGLLVVQTATSGSFAHHAGGSTLTLHGVYPSVTFFSDRPERTAGQLPNAAFAELWSQPTFQADPPNAALTISGGPPSSDVFVLELRHPRLQGRSISYDVTQVNDSGITNLDRRRDPMQKTPRSFRDASLLIDDLSWGSLVSGIGGAIANIVVTVTTAGASSSVEQTAQDLSNAAQELTNQAQELTNATMPQEAALVQQMTTEVDQIENQLQQNAGSLSPSQVAALEQTLGELNPELNAARQLVQNAAGSVGGSAQPAQGSTEPAQQSTETAQGGG